MKNKKASNKALLHVICCVIIIVLFAIVTTRVNALNTDTFTTTSDGETLPLRFDNNDLLEIKRIKIEDASIKLYNKPKKIEKDINYYINIYDNEIKFYSTMFGYDYEYIKSDIINRSKDIETIEPTNIASIKDENGNLINYSSKELGLIEYFYILIDTDKNRTRKYTPYNGSSDYVEKLIEYYTQIYDNVDTTLALSIGAAESGYYTVTYMLKQNNIYGGMSYSGLIKYDNIEIGVLTYIRMLSKNYINKGLITVEQIGRDYCPTYNESGYKIASPHWVNLVNKAKEKYINYTDEISIEELIEIQNS